MLLLLLLSVVVVLLLSSLSSSSLSLSTRTLTNTLVVPISRRTTLLSSSSSLFLARTLLHLHDNDTARSRRRRRISAKGVFENHTRSRDNNHRQQQKKKLILASSSSSSDQSSSSSFVQKKKKKTTLTCETLWNIRIQLRSITTTRGNIVNHDFNIRNIQFIEDDGYEPPQGTIKIAQQQQKKQTSSSSTENDNNVAICILNSRWILSEDPNDRKDGLWVWGLFKEPLYPFILIQIQLDTIPLLPSTSTSRSDDAGIATTATDDEDVKNDDDSIPPLKLYIQMNHRRDKDIGVLLGDGGGGGGGTSSSSFTPTPIYIRKSETINADMFGVSEVDVYDEINVGVISILPQINKS